MDSTPLHVQVSDQLRRDIDSQTVTGLLPSEAEMTKMFSVSRSVVRQALGTLESEGLVTKVHGRGSFVVPRERLHRIVQSLNGLGMQLEKFGVTTQTEVLEYALKPYPDAPTEWEATKAYHIVRLRYGWGTPLSLIETWIPQSYGTKIKKKHLVDQSLHQQMKDRLGLVLTRSQRSILALPSDAKTAAHLQIPIGAPLLSLEGKTYDDNNFPVEVFKTLHRADRIVFDVETAI